MVGSGNRDMEPFPGKITVTCWRVDRQLQECTGRAVNQTGNDDRTES